MKILIDHQIFSLQKYGGISRYFANLHKSFKDAGHESIISALYTENEYIINEPLLFNNTLGRTLFAGKLDRYYAWNRRFSRWSVQAGKFDVFHQTFDDPYFINYIKKPCVVTIHDMIHEMHPEFISNAAHVIPRKKAVMEKADAIIAISEFTKQDIIKLYPHMANKIHVVYHGHWFLSNKTGFNSALPAKYILFVGERWHYKNFAVFVDGISTLLQADKELKLVCAGGKAFTAAELEQLNRLKISEQCMQMDADDDLLQQLYTQATVFALPSLHEGFGRLLLEAFDNKSPVICSSASCLPEIAADAALYFDPYQPEDIKRATEMVLNNPALQQELRDKGTKRLADFKLEDCVANTIKVYQSVI